jgi:endonuclease YncB( thermonuclease family)
MRRQLLLWTMVLLVAVGCSAPDPLSALDELEVGERGRVVRVIDGDALVLDTGQSVRLIGIEAPARPYKEREGQSFHKEAQRMLEDMALGREVELRYAGLTRDRYDRALAHVVTDDALGARLWLNMEMIQRGGARVRVYADTSAANAPLVPAEVMARDQKRGLWKGRAYQIPSANDLPQPFERFQIVEGVVGGRASTAEQGASCEFPVLGSPLRLEIKQEAAEICQMALGTKVRARGYIFRGKMEIAHPLSVEVLARN